MRRTAVAGVVLVALLACASGGAASGGLTRALPTIAVTLKANGCSLSARSASTDTLVFVVSNRSLRPGRFVIAGRKTPRLLPSRTTKLRVTLREGSHRYTCTPRGGGTLLAVAGSTEHRIGVRTVGGVGELVDNTSGRRFMPRGANYTRLGPVAMSYYHVTFNVDDYRPARADQALAQMRAAGYDTVRVFLTSICGDVCLGLPGGTLRPAYVANLVDFLRRAKASRVFVVVTLDFLPWIGRYGELMVGKENVGDQNPDFLTRVGVDTNAAFFRELAGRLVSAGAPLDAVLAYELRNEVNWDWNSPPLSATSGSFTAANGQTYDLSSASEREALMEDGLAYFVDTVRAAIRVSDPTALVTIGFDAYAPTAGGRSVIGRSSADFVDIHPYPGWGYSLDQYMESYGITQTETKPIVIGEMGATKDAYASPADGAEALKEWQAASCRYGIDGWLIWTWDTDEQRDLWSARSGGGVIGRALSPVVRPDPCAAAE